MNLLPALNPTIRLWDIPLEGEEVSPYFEYTPNLGTVVRDWIPYGCGRAMVIVNGQALMQHEWVRPVLQGDVIDWHLLPCGGGSDQNKGTSRQVLTIIAVIVIAYFTGGLGLSTGQAAALSIGLNLAAQVLINALIPINPVVVQDNSPASVYNVALSSNQARIYQPIPVIYGRMRTFPDFAAQPYSFYIDNDQYYAAIFCVGHGYFAFEKVQIDDTSLKSLNDAVFYKVLDPGVAPTRVLGNVVTAPEVTGQELKAGKYVGGYTLSGSGYPCERFEIDIIAAQGLGYAEADGSITPLDVTFVVGCRLIDDFGAPAGAWVNLGAPITLVRNSRTPQRVTYSFDLPAPGRYEIRIVRTTVFYDDDRHINTINWAGLRGFLVQDAPLNANATHLEVLMKATDQLSGLNQRKFNVVVRRKIRRWTGIGWTAPVESRSLADAVSDVLTNTVYGCKLEENAVDLDGFAELGEIWDARQDHFDIMFDSRQSVRDVLNTIGQAGRAKIYQRNGVYTAARDQHQDLPVAAYTSRNITPGSASINYALATPETADQVIIEYFDNRQWDWVPIKCNAPGVTTPVNPVTIRVNGITGYTQALREGTYMAAANLRRKFPAWETEMDGLLPTYGSAVIFAPAMPGWGQAGDVVDVAGLTLSLSEPPVFLPGTDHFISLIQLNGTPSAAIRVLPGPTPYDVVLTSSPGFTPLTSDSQVERTRYIFGPEGQHRTIVRLLNAEYKGRSSSGSPMMQLSGVEENDLVHLADNAYLPVGGVIQDPVPSYTAGDSDTPSVGGGEGGGGGYLYVVELNEHRFYESTLDLGAVLNQYTNFRNDGTLDFTGSTGFPPGTPGTEWMRFGAVEPTIAAAYEIRATMRYGLLTGAGAPDELREPATPTAAFDFALGTFGTWHNLGTDQVWVAQLGPGELDTLGFLVTGKYFEIRFEIREAASGVIQDSCIVIFQTQYIDGGGGP